MPVNHELRAPANTTIDPPRFSYFRLAELLIKKMRRTHRTIVRAL